MSEKQETPSNENSVVKVYCKIFPTLSSESTIKITPQKVIKLTDGDTKKSVDFQFDHIFDQNTNVREVYSFVHETSIVKLFDNINVCVISLGQKRAGKTHTLFGDSSMNLGDLLSPRPPDSGGSRGMAYKVYETLIRSGNDLQDKEYQVNCNFLEVHRESVRDLLSGFNPPKDLDDSMDESLYQEGINRISKKDLEGLEVHETSNGQINIKNLSIITLTNMKLLELLIQYGFKRRESFHRAIMARDYGADKAALERDPVKNSHLVMNINFILKDKDNYNFPSLNSTVQLVELACAEKISKDLEDGSKFQGQLCLNAQISALQRILIGIHKNRKILPYKESKLTKVMQNYCNLNSEIVTISHIIPTQENFTECLNYLNLSSRFKYKEKELSISDEVSKMTGQEKGEINNNILTTEEERMVKKLRDEIAELTARHEYMNKEYRGNLVDIGNMIGASEDLKELINKPNSRFWNTFKEKKLVLNKILNLEQSIIQKEKKKLGIEKYIETFKEEFNEKKERWIAEKFQLEDEIAYFKDQIQIDKNLNTKLKKDIVSKKAEDAIKLADANKRIITEKSTIFQSFPMRHLKADTDIPTIKQNALEGLKDDAFLKEKETREAQLEILRHRYSQIELDQKSSYENALRAKVTTMEETRGQFLKKLKKKKIEEKKILAEMISLEKFVRKQHAQIENNISEQQKYGPVNIPMEELDRIELPTRERFLNLFIALDSGKIAESLKQRSSNNDSINSVVVNDLKKTLSNSLTNQNALPPHIRDNSKILTLEEIAKLDPSKAKYEEMIEMLTNLQTTLIKEKQAVLDLDKKIEEDYDGGQLTELMTMLKERERYQKLVANQEENLKQGMIALSSQTKMQSLRLE